MVVPDYKGGSIVNLVSSISSACGYKTRYNSLRILQPKELKKSKNIVLILIDGLGYEYLMKYGKRTIFNENIKGKMTSVFPSSTSAAIPSMMTGSSPREHGMTGWFMFLKEFGCIVIPLPYILKLIKFPMGYVLDVGKIINLKPLTDRIKVRSYLVQSDKILDSDFTVATSGRSKRVGYKTLSGYLKAIRNLINSNNQRKYIYAYYSDHDNLCHKYGSSSKKVLDHFKNLDSKLRSFIKSIEGTDTTVIITADHGIIDIPAVKRIKLKHHPRLREMLTIPLMGEHRFVYCYVKSSKDKEFRKYVKTKLKHCCTLYKSQDLVKRNYFGFGKTHGKLFDRIGDYTMVMKDNYGIYDPLAYEEERYTIGSHGGLSKEEMVVPLIVIKK